MKFFNKSTVLCLGALMCTNLAYAETKTTKNLTSTSIQKKEIENWQSKTSLLYWGEAVKKRINEADSNAPDSKIANLIFIRYKLSSTLKLEIIPRFYMSDNKEDKFTEQDTRIGLSATAWESVNKKTSLWTALRFELPHTQESQNNEKLTMLKVYTAINHHFDQYNSLTLLTTFNKELRKESAKSSAHNMETWASYTNSYFSENYPIRIDYEGLLTHKKGSSDLSFNGEHDMFNIGATMKFSKIKFYPYLRHDISGTKALNTLGAGFQLTASI